jgi:hypothetical protein
MPANRLQSISFPSYFLSVFQAKQRASVKWLLSKSYNNRVPEKLREPYYRDHEVSFNNVIINLYIHLY